DEPSSQEPIMKTIDTVRSFYGALGNGDLPTALGLLTPDVHWLDPKGFPYGGDLHAVGDVRTKVFERILTDFQPFAIDVERALAVDDGEHVVVLGTYRGTFAKTGKSIEAPFVHVWRGRPDKLTSFAVHTDTATFQAVMK